MSLQRALSVLLADDENIVLKTIGDYLRDSGHHVDESPDGLSALQLIKERDYDVALLDMRMPGMDGLSVLSESEKIRPEMPVVIITGHGDMDLAIQALRLGAADFLAKPIKLLELDAVMQKAMRNREFRQERFRLRETIGTVQSGEALRLGGNALVGTSSATARVREQITEVVEAGCDSILITGETGTGKEVVAREIHFRACPKESPFIAVSCPSLPDSLVQSEFFGHAKGAFTGAAGPRAGYFELADGGTLFLDEIADLSPSSQASLLRVLETRALRRVGGGQEITVNVRVIAATNASLEEFIRTGKFRRDLFYRLNGYSIHLLPLRERREDIVPLAEHFLTTYAACRGIRFEGFSPEATEVLRSYDYPGNARELRNLVERAAILCRSGLIDACHLSLQGHCREATSAQNFGQHTDAERTSILQALHDARWNRREAARKLGMPYSTLRYKMQQLGIS